MTKQSRSDLEKLLEEQAPFLRIAGVPEQQINVAKGPNYKVHHYVRAFDWLHEFILSDELAAWKRVRAMRPEETWKHYDLIGVEGLREQELLQEASKKLLRRWRLKRPRMFGPDREKKNGKDDGTDVQPDQEDSPELCV